jgi:hypothetical protein
VNGPEWLRELPERMTEAEYCSLPEEIAAAGIPLYLVVVLDDTYDIWEIREFHLDAAESTYRLHAVHRSVLELEHPVRLKLPISDLVAG